MRKTVSEYWLWQTYCGKCGLVDCRDISQMLMAFNILRPRQNGRHFPDDIFKCIFLNENVWISIKIPLKFVPKGQINNIPALVQIMAWRRPGDKSLSEPMVVSLLSHTHTHTHTHTHIYVYIYIYIYIYIYASLGPNELNYGFILPPWSLWRLLVSYRRDTLLSRWIIPSSL